MKRFSFFSNNVPVGPWIVIFCLTAIAPCLAGENFKLDYNFFVQAEKQYGFDAKKRLSDWQNLIRDDISGTEREQLEKVNAFLNQFEFVSDQDHWGEKDYWATPMEFIASNGGDCEDFSVAKYFTLKAMGIPERKLSLTYVQALSLDTAHMVLVYVETPGADPLVLDNLIEEIKPASERPDLLPVYSFNGRRLWIAKRKGRGALVGKSEKLDRWKELMERMPQGLI